MTTKTKNKIMESTTTNGVKRRQGRILRVLRVNQNPKGKFLRMKVRTSIHRQHPTFVPNMALIPTVTPHLYTHPGQVHLLEMSSAKTKNKAGEERPSV